ncbi:MAG: hypothetical protein ACR2P8_08545 [Myxococcota bacterium]
MRRFQVFAFLWCSATLLHQLYQGRLLVLDATAPLSFAALYAIARPSSLARFALLLAIQLVTVLWELPRVVNHWLLMGVTSVGLLIVLVPALLAQRRGEDVAGVAEAALGPVRVQLVIVYLWATFHKLNAGFFDPEFSCGVDHYVRLAGSLGFLPQGAWTRTPAIVGTLAIEAALPVLLAFRATRWLALLMGWGFHLVLGWNGFWDFSSVGSAYYAAFVPLWALAGFDGARPARPWLDRLATGAARLGRSRWAFPIAAALLVASLAGARLLGADGPEAVLAVNRAGRLVWLACWLALGGVLLLSLLAGHPLRARHPEPAATWWRRPALWIAPALLFANGFSPYLGLKSEHSYAMFSNLRTEGGTWNHYLMPRGLRVFGYGDQVIRIRGSSDLYLQNLARHGFGLVPLELRRHVARRPGLSVTYVRDGQVVQSGRAAGDPFLMEPLRPLERKLILFRPVPPLGGNACLH